MMYVYSGECRLCACGFATGQLDDSDEPLYTGDIVLVFTRNYSPDGLTGCVRKDCCTTSDGRSVTHAYCEDPGEP